MLQFLIYIFLTILIIYTGHQLLEYCKNAMVPKITKNMYHTQVEKYESLVKELQDECNRNNTIENKIDIEADLIDFVDKHI